MIKVQATIDKPLIIMLDDWCIADVCRAKISHTASSRLELLNEMNLKSSRSIALYPDASP